MGALVGEGADVHTLSERVFIVSPCEIKWIIVDHFSFSPRLSITLHRPLSPVTVPAFVPESTSIFLPVPISTQLCRYLYFCLCPRVCISTF